MGMWFRGLLSFLCLVLGVSAFVLWDCATSVVDVVASDPLGLCATVAGLGIAQLGWMAGGLAVIAMVALGLIWIPVIRAARHGRKAQPERALLANLALFLVLSFFLVARLPVPAAAWPRLIVDLICSQLLIAAIGPWFFALQTGALEISRPFTTRYGREVE